MALQRGIRMRWSCGDAACVGDAEMLRSCSRRAGWQAEARVHGHAGTSARTVVQPEGLKQLIGRTYGGFVSYGPAGRTFSILDLIQQRPTSPEVNTNRGG